MNEQITQIYGYLHGMWRYRWSALFIAWLVSIVGWLLVYTLPDKYESLAVVYIDTSSVMKPLLKGLAPETDTDDELQVMSRVLLSRENLLSVIREADMDLKIDSPREREAMVKGLASAIQLKGGGAGSRWDKRNKIYEISYQSTSANQTYQVVSNLLSSITQIAEYEKRLSGAEQQLATFKKANVGYMPDEKGGYYSRLQRAQDAVEQTRSALRLAERRYVELKRQLEGESLMLSSDSYGSGREAKIRRYQQQLDALLDQYTEQYPDVRATKAIIMALKAGRDGGIDEPVDNADGEEFNPVYQEVKVELSKASVAVGTLKTELAEKEAYVERLKSSIDIIPEVEAKLAKLNRGYEVTRERYLELVERRESAQLAQNAGLTTGDVTFRIIEPPVVPSKPSAPDRIMLLSTVLFVAFGAGLAWSFLRFMLKPTFINIKQVAYVTGLPVLGTVSLYLVPEHKRQRRVQLASFLSATFLLVVAFVVVLLMRDTGVAILDSLVRG